MPPATQGRNLKGLGSIMKKGKRVLFAGVLLLVLFAIWTLLIQTVDVQPAGETGTEIGFATLNCRFHTATGVHMTIYYITDWLGLIPVVVCILFGGIGLVQLLRRKSLFKVDLDIRLLGLYYGIVILWYLFFERFPVNYRPILIEGFQEASYPSSTTLLVLSVMPTLVLQGNRRLQSKVCKEMLGILTSLFSLFTVTGRLLSGVHWVTDIVGAVLLSTGLFCMYKASVLLFCTQEK